MTYKSRDVIASPKSLTVIQAIARKEKNIAVIESFECHCSKLAMEMKWGPIFTGPSVDNSEKNRSLISHLQKKEFYYVFVA